jgi:uncharacterized membrane protein
MAEEARIFSSTEALRFGWRGTMSNLKPLLAIGAIGALLSFVREALTSRGGAGVLLAVGVQILQAVVMLALIRASLKLHDGERIDWARPFDLLTGFVPYLITSVLYGLIVFGGLLLLIVPGILWAVKFGYATFAVVDKKLDPIEALRESSRLTKGERWHLLGFGLLVIGVNLLGTLAFGIGLLVTIPTTTLAAAYVFRRLQARAMSFTAAPFSSAPVLPTGAESH